MQFNWFHFMEEEKPLLFAERGWNVFSLHRKRAIRPCSCPGKKHNAVVLMTNVREISLAKPSISLKGCLLWLQKRNVHNLFLLSFFGGKQLLPISRQECHPQAGAEMNVPHETYSLQEEGKGVSCKGRWIMMTNDPFPSYTIYSEMLSGWLVFFSASLLK